MRSVELQQSVGSIGLTQEGLPAGIFTANEHTVLIVTLSGIVQLVPEGTDTVLLSVS